MKRLFSILFLVILTACSSNKVEVLSESLPYYAEANFNPVWFDNDTQLPKDFHQIPSFELYNQTGKLITEKNLENKIVVADFFFTSCSGICPKMTSNMGLLQEAFIDDEDILLLSHSVTPEADSISVLNSYAAEKGINSSKWHLLTGERETIYSLGRNAYFVEEDEGIDKGNDDFLHTENFVLIDENRHIRGIYNGLNKADIKQLIADIGTLKNKNQ